MRHSFFAGIALALAFSFQQPASADSLAFFAHVTSDAFSNMACDLSLGVSDTNEIQGLEYDCSGDRTFKKFFALKDIRKGAVLYHFDELNLDVITISAPNLDPVHGGAVTIRYLSNGLTREYKNWDGSLEPQGLKWIAYTSTSAGHQAFNQLFAAKRTIFGQLVGIQEIRTSWK